MRTQFKLLLKFPTWTELGKFKFQVKTYFKKLHWSGRLNPQPPRGPGQHFFLFWSLLGHNLYHNMLWVGTHSLSEIFKTRNKNNMFVYEFLNREYFIVQLFFNPTCSGIYIFWIALFTSCFGRLIWALVLLLILM